VGVCLFPSPFFVLLSIFPDLLKKKARKKRKNGGVGKNNELKNLNSYKGLAEWFSIFLTQKRQGFKSSIP
jgi:hypothetical protein